MKYVVTKRKGKYCVRAMSKKRKTSRSSRTRKLSRKSSRKVSRKVSRKSSRKVSRKVSRKSSRSKKNISKKRKSTESPWFHSASPQQRVMPTPPNLIVPSKNQPADQIIRQLKAGIAPTVPSAFRFIY